MLGVGLELGEHRSGEGVADDRHGVDPLALDGVEQLGHVEVAGCERHHAAAHEQGLKRSEGARAVHQWTSG